MLKHLTQTQIEAIIDAAKALNKVSPPGEQELSFSWHDLSREFEEWKKLEPLEKALRACIRDLPLEARFELMAIMWLGRGDVPDASFDDFLKHARRHTDEGDVYYIAEKWPSLPMYLRRGLEKLKVPAPAQ
jgi:hypothetical protein